MSQKHGTPNDPNGLVSWDWLQGFHPRKIKESKSPRHQRTVNRVNPGVATRLRARLRGKDLRIRREMVTFVHWERWLWVTNPDEAPRTAGCWFFISKMRQLPNLPTTWPYGVAGVEVKPLPDFGRNIDLPWFTIYFDVHQSIRVLTHSHMSMLRYVQICGRPYLSLWYTVHRYTHTLYIYVQDVRIGRTLVSQNVFTSHITLTQTPRPWNWWCNAIHIFSLSGYKNEYSTIDTMQSSADTSS